MPMSDKSLVSELTDLLRTCNDSVKLVEEAASLSEDERLTQCLQAYAAEHRAIAEQLRAEIEERGGEPLDDGSFTGTLFRAWLEFAADMTEHNPQTILSAVEKAQARAVDVYEDYLLKDWPPDVLDLVHRQYRLVHDDWQQIRDAYIRELNIPDV